MNGRSEHPVLSASPGKRGGLGDRRRGIESNQATGGSNQRPSLCKITSGVVARGYGEIVRMNVWVARSARWRRKRVVVFLTLSMFVAVTVLGEEAHSIGDMPITELLTGAEPIVKAGGPQAREALLTRCRQFLAEHPDDTLGIKVENLIAESYTWSKGELKQDSEAAARAYLATLEKHKKSPTPDLIQTLLAVSRILPYVDQTEAQRVLTEMGGAYPDNPLARLYCLFGLGDKARMRGDQETAEARFIEGLRIPRESLKSLSEDQLPFATSTRIAMQATLIRFRFGGSTDQVAPGLLLEVLNALQVEYPDIDLSECREKLVQQVVHTAEASPQKMLSSTADYVELSPSKPSAPADRQDSQRPHSSADESEPANSEAPSTGAPPPDAKPPFAGSVVLGGLLILVGLSTLIYTFVRRKGKT